MDNGLVHIYCGDGKGKTTCATGLAVRCAGNGGRVLWFQFLKTDMSSERKSLENLDNIDMLSGYPEMKFTFKMSQEEKEAAADFFDSRFEEIVALTKNDKYDMLILDEVLDAVALNMLSENKLINFLENKPKGLEIVLTGRDPSEKLCSLADYISEIKKIKHPYDKGINARKGIEY